MAEPLVFDGSPLDRYLQESLDTATPSSSQRANPDTLTPSSSFQSLKSAHALPHAEGSSSSIQTAHASATQSRDRTSNQPGNRTPHNSGNCTHSTSNAPFATFLQELSNILKWLATDFCLPFVLSILRDLTDLLSAPPTDPSTSPADNSLRSGQAQRDILQDSTLPERFKLTICSSFLLTSSLSISFYDTEPTAQTDSPSLIQNEQHRTSEKSVRRGQRPSSFPIVARSDGLPHTYNSNGLAANHLATLPKLDTRGRAVRNVSLCTTCILAICSPSWTSWIQAVLIIACMSWSAILLLGLTDNPVFFELSRKPRPETTAFLRTFPIDTALSASQSDSLRQVALRDVSRLVRSLQNFDVSVNKAINAIQEVELVSRGFKLTQPLPPISRIEAASGSAWPHRPSPTPPRRTLLSSSAGSSSYGRVPSLGKGHPTSPESISHDADLRRVSDYTRATNMPVRRLLELRKVIAEALDGTQHVCQSTAVSLDQFIDKEEFGLLKDMYALDAHVEASEPELSNDWPNDDLSATSMTSPPLGVDRSTAWTSTIPRGFGSNVRQAETLGRTFASPRSGHKRLSLVSDSGSVLNTSTDRHNGTSSAMSNRSNMLNDHASSVYRSPRLTYVSDRSSSMGGPNESAALKRMSYRSASSAASSSHHMRSPSLHSVVFGSATAPSPPLASSKPKRNSLLGLQPVGASVADGVDESHDELSLLELKGRFEAMHRSRRQFLCRLLALHLSFVGTIALQGDKAVKADAYWQDVCSLMNKLRRSYEEYTDTIKRMVQREMGLAPPAGRAPLTEGGNPSVNSTQSRLVGHPGLEDRLNAMMLALRSVQAKIRVCAEEIQVSPPPALHGFYEGTVVRREAGADADPSENMERVLSTMRDDLLGLSAEWEASLQILRKDSTALSDSNPINEPLIVPEDLISPLETDDIADPMLSHALSGLPQDGLTISDDRGLNEDENDLAALLLGSTSPNALPPPGLEQVFESIAGMAGMPGLGSRLTRDERIAQARQKRQEPFDATLSSRVGGLDSSGMMSELNNVIHSRKVAREQLTNAVTAEPQPNDTVEQDEKSHVFALGSPLDLGAAGREGVFGNMYSGRNGARRSVSSLDMARARSRQSLEADDSFSDGFSDDLSRSSAEFSFEATALESVPEGGATEAIDSPSLKSTPRAAQTPRNRRQDESPFDLGAQVAAYARRKAAASTSFPLNGV